jgi:hypothetical protein
MAPGRTVLEKLHSGGSFPHEGQRNMPFLNTYPSELSSIKLPGSGEQHCPGWHVQTHGKGFGGKKKVPATNICNIRTKAVCT